MNLSSLSKSAVTKSQNSGKFVTLSAEALQSVVGGAGVYFESLPGQALAAMYRATFVGYEMALGGAYSNAAALYQDSLGTSTRQY
jgi:hypothetical protein